MDVRRDLDWTLLRLLAELKGEEGVKFYVGWREFCNGGKSRTYIYDTRVITNELFEKLSPNVKRQHCLYYVGQSGIVRHSQHADFLNESIESVISMLEGGWRPDSGPKCECGTKSPQGQNHSRWCGLFRSEF